MDRAYSLRYNTVNNDWPYINMALLIYNLVLVGMREGIYEGKRREFVHFIVEHTGRDENIFAKLEAVISKVIALEERITAVKKTP